VWFSVRNGQRRGSAEEVCPRDIDARVHSYHVAAMGSACDDELDQKRLIADLESLDHDDVVASILYRAHRRNRCNNTGCRATLGRFEYAKGGNA